MTTADCDRDERLICDTCGEMGQVTRNADGRYCVSAHRDGKLCCQTMTTKTAKAAIKRWERLTDIRRALP